MEIEAGGQDIWDAADDMKFVYSKRSGDFDVQVQFTAEDPGSNRAGLMARQNTTVNSPSVSELTHSSGLEGAFKRATAGSVPNTDVGLERWLSPIANWTEI